MQYISGRRVSQDFGVPGITTNDTVINVDGRIAAGIGTSATASVDAASIRFRGDLIDTDGLTGEIGYFLTKDAGGLVWSAINPTNENSVFVSQNGSQVGVSSYIGFNFTSDNNELVAISTNTGNPAIADIEILSRWNRDANTGIYTSKNIGIGSTTPNVALDIVGDGNFTGIVTANKFAGNSASVTNLNVSGVSTFVGISTFSKIGIGLDNPTSELEIIGGAKVSGILTAGSLDVTGSFNVASATTATNLANGVAGQISYQTAPGITGFLTTGISNLVLTSNGPGQAPTWQVAGIASDANIETTGIITATGGFVGDLTGNAATADDLNINATNRILFQDGDQNTAALNHGTNTTYLLQSGSSSADPSWIDPGTLNVATATTATNLANGVAGQISYQTAPGATGFLTTGLSNQVLTSQGSGQAPIWQNVESGISGITILDEGSLVGSSGSISNVDFVGNGVVAEATAGGNIATVTFNIPGVDGNTGVALTARDVIGGIGSITSLTVSGVTTSSGGFVGNLTGTASTASFATTAFSLNGVVESDLNVATAVTATNLSDAANITTGTISSDRLTGSYAIDITGNAGTASTASFATTAFTLNNKVETDLNVATAVTATNVIGGIGSITSLTVSGISSSSAFADFDYLQAPFDSTVTFTVTVASKDTTHRYNGTGSGNAYLINGVQAPFLTLTPGRTYRFTNDNTGSHPLKFYLEADKTTEYTSGVSFQNTYTELTVGDETPTVLHYQCTAHAYMGNAIQVNSNVVNTNYPAVIRDTLSVSGVTTLSNGIDVTGHTELDDVNVSGAITATTFTGDLTGNAGTATTLATARDFSITGDFVTAPVISFNGSADVAFAATITENSIGLGTYTTGDYVKTVAGTANEIQVTGGTGEGSTPTIGFDANPTIGGNVNIGQDLTVTRDLQVTRNLNVDGNVTIGGTSATIFAETLKVSDPDLILGVRTDASGTDISNDTTANHGGIAIASTEGDPLITLVNPGAGETLPSTYKKIMWFKTSSFTGLSTDAWLSNYAFGVGTTSMSAGTKFAVGNIETDFDDITNVRNINATGITTSSGGFVGNLTGNAGTATTATNLADAANITTGTISSDRLTGSYAIDITGNAGTASTASFATTAFTLNGVVESDLNVAFAQTAGIATYTSEWILGANGSSDYTFTGPGFTGAENDPTLYLTRGQQYKFTNNSGGSHPFRIQSTPNGSTGTQYNDGITNNDTSTGTLTWNVQFDAPDILYYQCTNHSGMGGKIYIVNAGIASDVSVNTTGIITAFQFFGDGSQLSGISAGIEPTENTTNQAQFVPFFTGTATTSIAGISTTKFVFNPSTTRMGIGTDTPGSTLEINVGTATSALDIQGSAGQLFSVTNNLTSGSIFSVNDVSGIPSIDVDADGTIQLAPFGATEFVGVGTTNPTAKLHVVGDTFITGVVTATDFNSTSDARLKTNVQIIDDPLEKVLQINGVSFNWIKDNKLSMGVIADNIQEVLPELVSGSDPKTVNYNGLIGLLIEVVKEQQIQIDSLNDRLSRLE